MKKLIVMLAMLLCFVGTNLHAGCYSVPEPSPYGGVIWVQKCDQEPNYDPNPNYGQWNDGNDKTWVNPYEEDNDLLNETDREYRQKQEGFVVEH